MKKITIALLAAALALALCACGGAGTQQSNAQPVDYTQVILNARDADTNDAYAVVSADNGGEAALTHNPFGLGDAEAADTVALLQSVLGLTEGDAQAYAFSLSPMNVRAYAVGVFKPAEGKEEALKSTLNAYIRTQQQNFENYLPDQYELAKNAVLETAPSGEIILALCENAGEVASSIKNAL